MSSEARQEAFKPRVCIVVVDIAVNQIDDTTASFVNSVQSSLNRFADLLALYASPSLVCLLVVGKDTRVRSILATLELFHCI